ncbi:MAG: DNA primase [Magnetococcales bacterium]|nr:DNA primase [Magnetococcales bacterium]
MARYPDSFLDRLKERVDLVELIGRHLHLKKKGSSWVGLCPFHHEKTPSFNVRGDHGYFKCFGCDAKGDAIDFLMHIQGLPFQDAVETLAREAGLELPAPDPRSQRQSRDEAAQRAQRQQLQELLLAANRYFQTQLTAPAGEVARSYLTRRGVQAATIQKFGLGFAPPGWRNLINHFGGGAAAAESLEKVGLGVVRDGESRYRGESGRTGEGNVYDRFRNRITFPIHDHRKRLVGFGGRLLEPGEPKYINTPETELYQKGRILYGLDQAQPAIQRQKRVLVVEGYLDMIALVEHGFDHTVATLGTALTAEHLQLLWRRCHHITFCFDGDIAGRKAAWRALERVMDGLVADRRIDFIFLPKGEDPDQVVRREGKERFQGYLRNAQPLLDFLLAGLSEELPMDTPEGVAALVHRVRDHLLKVGDPLLQGLFADEIGRRVGLSGAQVLGRLAITRPPQPLTPGRGGHGIGSGRGGHAGRHPATFSRPMTAGRNFEQLLLAILLRHPRVVQPLEDDLTRLELEDTGLNALLHVCIRLAGEWGEQAPLPLEQLPSPEMRTLAQTILAAEEGNPEDVARELEGCLDACLRRGIDRDIRRLQEKARAAGNWTDQELMQLSGYKKEKARLDRKRRVAPAVH